MFFRHQTWRQTSDRAGFGRPMGLGLIQWAKNSMRILLTIALLLIGLSAFVLVFPMVLAIVIAAFMLVGAIFCLGLVWNIYWFRRRGQNFGGGINVTVRYPDDDIIDEPS